MIKGKTNANKKGKTIAKNNLNLFTANMISPTITVIKRNTGPQMYKKEYPCMYKLIISFFSNTVDRRGLEPLTSSMP